MIRRLAAGCAFAAAAAAPSAASDPAHYPAAQCAAFWFGWHDLARTSSILAVKPGDLARAEAFRILAHRLTTTDPEAIDTFIAQQRRLMVQMIDDGIYGAGESRSLMERLLQTCEEYGATQPETSAG